MKKVSKVVKTVPPEVTFQSPGLGTQRSAGSLIVLLLNLESPESRAGILASVAKALNIYPLDITEAYHDTMCPKCGMSMVLHKKNNGKCF